jgi:multidrug efflux pump subunit AcrA (membrane-fusion protein)
VQPGRTWRAIARSEGRVTAVHAQLRAGARLEEDALVVEVDPTPFNLEIARLEADLARSEAELDELTQREANDRASLAIERESLALAEGELERNEGLLAKGTISQSVVDSTRRTTLTQRQSVRALEASLALLPSQRAAKVATTESQRASIKQAKLDLSYTSIRLPFPATLGLVNIEVGQFVARGEVLFEAYGTDRVDVDAEFLYGDARRIVGPEAAAMLSRTGFEKEAAAETLSKLFIANVRMKSGDLVAHWDGRVIGMRELVEASSRALSLRIAVDEPLAKAIPGVRPPLLPGSFCEVELRGLPLADRLVIPRTAILNGSVWILDAEDRLRRRSVDIEFEQGEAAVVASELTAGDRVLVSDPGSALEGSLVAPREDAALAASLRAAVSGEEARSGDAPGTPK